MPRQGTTGLCIGCYDPPLPVQGQARPRVRPPTEGKDDMARRWAIVIGVAAAGVMALEAAGLRE
jgi:hypothetical protein